MNKLKTLLLFSMVILSCRNESEPTKLPFPADEIPNQIPVEYKKALVPENKLIHRGIFSPDLQEYYYTISDKNFKKFEVFVIRNNQGNWSEPKKAFFSSSYSEHGMNFSPDGNSIYFSSTRPTNAEGVSDTWHIWRSDKIDGVWKEPVFIDIPNLREKLVSHPILTNSGTLYFHASDPDYSDMDIYQSKKVNGTYQNAEKTTISMRSETGKCTPYVSPNEDYMIFASIGDQLDLMISFNDGNGHWIGTRKLSNSINDFGQGNPYVTPDNTFLFFTTGEHNGWKIKWVHIAAEINNN